MKDFIKQQNSRLFIRFIFIDKEDYFQQLLKIEKIIHKPNFSSNLFQYILSKKKKYIYSQELTSSIHKKNPILPEQLFYFQFISFPIKFNLAKIISWHNKIHKLNKNFQKKNTNPFFMNIGYVNEEQVITFYSHFLPDRIYFQKNIFLKNELILKKNRFQTLDTTSHDFAFKESITFFEDLQKLMVFKNK